MMIRVRHLLLTLACLFLAGALAQEQERQMDLLLAVEHETYGEYVADMEGRTLYAFLSEEAMEAGTLEAMEEGVREEAGQCTDACLENWPPLLADIAQEGVAADESLEASLLYTANIDDREQVVYNGWPLYYYVEDQTEEDTLGQGRGGRWFMVAPDGSLIRTDPAETSGTVDANGATGTDADETTDDAATDAAPDGPAPDGDGADGAGATPDGPAPDGDAAGDDGADETNGEDTTGQD